MGFPLYVICHFSLVIFNNFFWSLIFVSLITMCLDVFLFGFILLGTLCASWTWFTISFSVLGKFSAIITSNIFSGPFFLSSPSVLCVCFVTQLCQLFVTSWTVAHQSPLSMGFYRQEYWSGAPCPPPGDLPLRDRTQVSRIAGGFFII